MSILTLGSKKKSKEGKFPIKEKAKKGKKENFQSKRKQKRKERKFPIKEREKAKRKLREK